MDDAFHDVPAFVAVVEAGGFAAASRRLNLSRSAVGKAVARLEDRLAVRLFHRTTRSLSLTEDGQAFFERCERALSELRAGQAMLESGHKTASGKLRVSMPVLFGRMCVAPVLMRLAASNPELELDLNFSDRLVDLVEDRFDLSVRTGSLDDAAGLKARRIGQEQTSLYASPNYVARNGEPGSLMALADHPAIAYGRSGRVQSWIFPARDAPAHVVIPPTRMRFDDLGTIADAATAGFGLAWLPSWLVRDKVRDGELVKVLADIPPFVSDIHVIWPVAPHLAMRVRVSIDALATELPTLSGFREPA